MDDPPVGPPDLRFLPASAIRGRSRNCVTRLYFE
jgi:hypothetical protein